MKKLQRKRKGFTLIELVVVIVIIAILAAVAMLSFGNFTKTARDSRIKSEHTQLITAGNMWRAAQENPDDVPASLDDIKDYMESSKPIIEPKDGDTTGHTYDDGVLTSTLSEGDPLVYDFKAK